VYGLSFLIVFVNAALAVAIMHRIAGTALPMLPLGAAAALVVVATIYGELRLRRAAPSGDQRVANDITVTVVQGGVRSGGDDQMVANEDAWRTYSRLTTQDPVGADLIIWPETVLRVHLRQDDYYRRRISTLVTRAQQALFVGALDGPRFEPGELNSGYLISPKAVSSTLRQSDSKRPGTDASQSDAAPSPDPESATSVQVYHKAVLLPFGEYVPGASWLPFLRRWQTTGQFVSGAAPHTLRLALPAKERRAATPAASRTTSFAPSICFEAIWPGIFNQLVRDGAEFLINITDDGWFGDSAAPYQHLDAVTMRAVETRRWLVRASNSGVSVFVDPTGRVVDSLPLGAVGVFSQPVEPLHALSPYVRWGDWLVVLCAFIVPARLLGNRRRLRASDSGVHLNETEKDSPRRHRDPLFQH